jgi:signal transduction histidine kinase
MNILDPLLDRMDLGIAVADSDFNLLYMNPAAERLLNLSHASKEILNLCRLLCSRLVDSNSRNCAISCPLRDQKSRQRAVTFVGRHGPHSSFNWCGARVERHEVWKNLRAHCLRIESDAPSDAEKERHVAIIEDATLEADRQTRKEDWQSMVAHDLRSPIMNIYCAFKLLEGVSPGQPLNANDIDLIRMGLRGCGKMTELLDLYLDLAKINAGSLPVMLEEVDVLDLLTEAAKEQELQAAKRSITVNITSEPGVKVRADEALLVRVCQNLIDNAIKYVQEGGRLEINASADAADSMIISFKDNGPGIPTEALPLLFDRFYQVEAQRKGEIRGTGLGLAFCREALRAMGGEIDVESTLGKGSEFRIRLPAAAERRGARFRRLLPIRVKRLPKRRQLMSHRIDRAPGNRDPAL